MTADLAVRAPVGAVEPRLAWSPPFFSSMGSDAVEFARANGLELDAWQAHCVEVGLRRRGAKWAAQEVAVIVARQNGKGAILEARELAGLFLFGEDLILHSAHEYKTAGDAFKRMRGIIQGSADLYSQVAYNGIRVANGEQGITLANGAELRYIARTSGSGRGFPAKLLIVDEAFNYPDGAQAALSPTLTAAADPQIWYTSTAVNQAIHPNGLNLARIRRRGMAGDDPKLAFMEYSVDEDVFRADPHGVAADPVRRAEANPALGIRVGADFLDGQLLSMGPRKFAGEHLAVGDWPADPDEDGALIPARIWDGLADRGWVLTGQVMFGMEVTPDRALASIGVASRDAAGVPHVELVDRRDEKLAGWVPGRLAELTARHCGSVVIDPAAPGGALLPELERLGVPVVKVTGREYAQACGGFYDAAHERKLRHSDQPLLNVAVDAAGRRSSGDAWVWDGRGSRADLTPLRAVTLALFGVSRARPVPMIF